MSTDRWSLSINTTVRGGELGDHLYALANALRQMVQATDSTQLSVSVVKLDDEPEPVPDRSTGDHAP